MHPLFERWAAKVDVSGGSDACWPWTAGCVTFGYGALKVGSRTDGSRRTIKAHRLAWEIFRFPIPAGVNVLHACDNPPCSNPAHLFLGSQSDNAYDRDRKRRRRRLCGEAHPLTKLTAAQVREVRASPKRSYQLAAQFNTAPSVISNIRNNRTWKDV